MKVSNMTSNRKGGGDVPNQFVIESDGIEYFQSYSSIIVKLDYTGDKKTVTLDCNKWDYSRTTGIYRNQFLGETKKETQKKIDSGEYLLADLNAA